MKNNTQNKDLSRNDGNTMLGEVLLDFNKNTLPEEYKVVIIKYRYKKATENHPIYEIGSAYYYNKEWWVNFYNPHTFSKEYEVLGWDYYKY